MWLICDDNLDKLRLIGIDLTLSRLLLIGCVSCVISNSRLLVILSSFNPIILTIYKAFLLSGLSPNATRPLKTRKIIESRAGPILKTLGLCR